MSSRWIGPLLALVLPGCALFGRGSAMESRYFSADLPASSASVVPAAPGDESLVVRLGRVRAGNDLKEEIVYRTSLHEVGYYEEFRWAERPETYLRRGLVQVLFNERGMRQSVAGAVPTLDVELIAFEEVRGEHPVAHVSLMAALHDERLVRYSRTIDVTRRLTVNARGTVDPTELATTLALALREAVRAVSDDVVRELSSAPGRGQAEVTP